VVDKLMRGKELQCWMMALRNGSRGLLLTRAGSKNDEMTVWRSKLQESSLRQLKAKVSCTRLAISRPGPILIDG
jgi:hypothetical protein